MSSTKRAWTRLRWAEGIGLAALLAAPGAAAGEPNFGGRIYQNYGSTYGGSAGIDTPPIYNETVAPDEILLHRVVTQSFSASNPGLIQAGSYRSGNQAHLDYCNASVDAYTLYVEYKPNNQGYKCALYPGAAPATAAQFKVYGDGAGNWRAQGASNGQVFDFGPAALGFTNGFTAISTEQNNGAATTADGSTSRANYGTNPPGGVWQVFSSPNRASSVTVSSPSQTVQFPHTNGSPGPVGTWGVPDVPSPVFFKHVP